MVVSEKTDTAGNALPKIKERTVTTKKVAPSLGAAIFALCNVDPENWRNRQNISIKEEVSERIDKANEEQLDQLINKLLKEVYND